MSIGESPPRVEPGTDEKKPKAFLGRFVLK
jgi:hypothetical protein